MRDSMTLYTHSGDLPRHLYVWVEPLALGKHEWIQAVRVLYEDRSFTDEAAEWPTWLRRQREIWSAET